MDISPGSACHSEPFAVILSEAKNLRISLRVNSARNLALSNFKTMRDSSSSANKNGGLLGMTGQAGFPAAYTPHHFSLAGGPREVKCRRGLPG